MLKTLAPAALAALLLAAGPALAEGDPAAGEKVYKKCKVCHMVGEGAKNRVGPPLNDIIGRQAGTLGGFNYSPAMKKAGEEGLVWTEEAMAEYLEAPRKYVKGTKMAFPGLKKEQEIADVIAYLKQFSE
ncbi:cytochrome c family protein [Minwuia thermotolerans]|uniref:Cytochrome c family protein n=2 Tax=Minwuia thermotolerans TaxID=2056226 RepID=A0A2M9FW24_9PROT|nr:cytochrome c family protein [Minwuia thermotolerans]